MPVQYWASIAATSTRPALTRRSVRSSPSECRAVRKAGGGRGGPADPQRATPRLPVGGVMRGCGAHRMAQVARTGFARHAGGWPMCVAARLAGLTVAGSVARLRMVSAPHLARAALIFAGAGCAASSGAADAGAQCPPGVACDCTYADGAYYNCGMDAGIPACAASVGVGASCASVSLGTLCATCVESAGEWCSCVPADAGPQWQCIGTEYPCKGP